MNNPDFYIYVLAALLPLSACMVVFQVNPYHALAIRGILGAVAAMLYAILGAADVSLTEALMGTMLAITLYAIAVRSSLILRLGVLENKTDGDFEQLLADFRTIFDKHYMRLEVVPYNNRQALQRALMEKEVHATCAPGDEAQPYHTAIRVKRIYEIVQDELSSPGTSLSYVNTPDLSETDVSKQNLEEQQI